MLLLEINEFNPALMRQAAGQLQAKHLQRLLSLRQTTTYTDEREERYGLDPWVQWVSIHTGQPASVHGVKHLADLSSLSCPQIWETLGKAGLRCGVWGAMNARRGKGQGLAFFLPDPWSFEQVATPAFLNDLLALPVYYAKNYGQVQLWPLMVCGLRLLKFLLRPTVLVALIPVLPRLLHTLCKHGCKDYVLFVLFDLVNAALFVQFYKKHKPDFSILFFNSLAHFQHHQWLSTNTLNKEACTVFSIMDQALGMVFAALDSKNESLVVANAFTQQNTVARREFLYRQKDPSGFLRSAGISFVTVEQLMTNDGHVFFVSREEALAAKTILEQARLGQQGIFHVDWDESMPLRLFFQISFWGEVAARAVLHINGRQMDFFDYFDCITQRSGSHVPEGDLFSSVITFPERMLNHRLYDYLLETMGVNKVVAGDGTP